MKSVEGNGVGRTRRTRSFRWGPLSCICGDTSLSLYFSGFYSQKPGGGYLDAEHKIQPQPLQQSGRRQPPAVPPHLYCRPPLRQPLPPQRGVLLLPPRQPQAGRERRRSQGPSRHPRLHLARRPRRSPALPLPGPGARRLQRHRPAPRRPAPLRPADRQHEPAPPGGRNRPSSHGRRGRPRRDPRHTRPPRHHRKPGTQGLRPNPARKADAGGSRGRLQAIRRPVHHSSSRSRSHRVGHESAVSILYPQPSVPCLAGQGTGAQTRSPCCPRQPRSTHA